MGGCAGDDCGKAAEGKLEADKHSKTLAMRRDDAGPSDLWGAVATAGDDARTGERRRGDLCFWHSGTAIGFRCASHTKNVSRLRSRARDSKRPVAAGAH